MEERETECMGWRRWCMPERPARKGGNRPHWPQEPDTCVNCRKLRGAQLSWWRHHMHVAAGGKVVQRQRQTHLHMHTHKTHSESRKGTEADWSWKGQRNTDGKNILKIWKITPKEVSKDMQPFLKVLVLHFAGNFLLHQKSINNTFLKVDYPINLT